MKKILICLMSATMILTVGGCSVKEPETTKEESNAIVQEVNAGSVKYFGKVKSIVGNEIKLELAKEMGPQLLDGTQGEIGDGVGIINSEPLPEGTEIDPGSISSSMAVSESAPDNKEDFAINGQATTKAIMSTGNGEKMKLEYTGETNNYVIPAGASIMNLVAGKDGKVSDIKEGSVIRLYMSATGDSQVVSNVEIME